jgi:hypothetical protein
MEILLILIVVGFIPHGFNVELQFEQHRMKGRVGEQRLLKIMRAMSAFLGGEGN